MRIVHVLPDLHVGGGQKLAINLCNEISQNNDNEVYLCVLAGVPNTFLLKQQVSTKVKLISLNKKKGFSIIAITKLYKVLKEINPDVVHTHLRAIFYASLSILFLKASFVHTFHTVAEREANSIVKKIYYKVLFTFLSVTPISISPLVLEGTRNVFGKQYDVMINNGTNPLMKSDDYESVKQEIEKLKNTQDTKVFIVIGRVSIEKNQLMLINIIKELQNLGSDILLLILGPLDCNQEYTDKCFNMAKSSPNIHFLGEKSNVGDYMYCSDALCVPSIREGLPLTILEAMSINKPVLATPVGGIPDIIKDGINGYLSEDTSPESFKKVLKKFISKPLKCNELNKKGFQEKYSMSVCAKQYYRIYKSLI